MAIQTLWYRRVYQRGNRECEKKIDFKKNVRKDSKKRDCMGQDATTNTIRSLRISCWLPLWSPFISVDMNKACAAFFFFYYTQSCI